MLYINSHIKFNYLACLYFSCSDAIKEDEYVWNVYIYEQHLENLDKKIMSLINNEANSNEE